MNSIQFEDAVRDYIREPRIASSIDGANFGSAAIGRYRTRAEREAYFITITKAKHLYIATYSIVGVTGQELYDIPGYGALNLMKRLMRVYKVTDPTNVRNQYREVSFDAARREGQTVLIDAAYVDARLGELSRNEDLSRYIL